MPENTSKPVGKRNRAVEARRRKIVEAALTCFVENGYHQTGVRDIAKQAGISLGNLYNHFPGKHDVLVEIARMERDELVAFEKILYGSGAPVKVLTKFVTVYAKYLADPETVILTLECASEAVRKPDIAALFEDNYQILVAGLDHLFARGMADGSFRRMPDAPATAALVLDVIEGSAYRCVLGDTSLRQSIKSLKDFILTAVGA